MVNTYNSMRDVDGEIVEGRSKLFVIKTEDDGSIIEHLGHKHVVPEEHGTLFIVDNYLLDQVDKLKMVDGQLSVKNGESIIEPVKSDKELKREALLKQLAELDATEDA